MHDRTVFFSNFGYNRFNRGVGTNPNASNNHSGLMEKTKNSHHQCDLWCLHGTISQVYHKKNLFLTTRACFIGICIMRHIFFTDFRKFIEKNPTAEFSLYRCEKERISKVFFFFLYLFNFDDVTYQYKNRTYQPNQGWF